MATIISDTKTTKTSRIAAAKSDPTAKSLADAKRKLHIHVVCILVAGTVATVLFQLRIGNATVLGFGPVAPSIAQELFDRIFRL
jgi:hypothetical protein